MIYNIKSPTELAGFYIVFDGSTLLETPGLRGASHLLEHLICKSFDHVQDELQSHGVYWNAYTSNNEVVFYLTGLETEVNLFRRRLLDAISKFNITEEQFQNEKSIVLQEYQDRFSDPYWAHVGNTLRSRFHYYDSIGHRGDLEALTLDMLRQYWTDWFQKPTKIINVSDRYQHFNSAKMSVVDVTDSVLLPDGHPDGGPVLIEGTKAEGNSVIILQTGIMTDKIPEMKVAMNMLSSGLNSPLYQEIREKRGLAYGVWMGADRFNHEYLIDMSCKVTDENVDAVVEVAREVLSRPTKYLTAERLEMVRREMLIDDKISAINRYTNIDPWLIPVKFQARTILTSVTLEEIHQVVKDYLDPSKLHLSVDQYGYCR